MWRYFLPMRRTPHAIDSRDEAVTAHGSQFQVQGWSCAPPRTVKSRRATPARVQQESQHIDEHQSKRAGFSSIFPTLRRVRRYQTRAHPQRDRADGSRPAFRSKQDWFYALAYLMRGRLSSAQSAHGGEILRDAKWVYYLYSSFCLGAYSDRISCRKDSMKPAGMRLPISMSTWRNSGN